MRILLVDDHPLIREGLCNVLRELDSALQIFEAENAEEAVALLEGEQDIDLVLLDLVLPGTQGMNLLATVRGLRPDVPVVVVSGHDAPQTVRSAIDSGAMGFISKSAPAQLIVSALRLVLAGGVYLPPQVLAKDRPSSSAPGEVIQPQMTLADLGLTGRQTDVLGLIVQGKRTKTICHELGLAEGTVKTHVAGILRALDVSSRTQAVFKLSRMGVTFPTPFRPRAPSEEEVVPD